MDEDADLTKVAMEFIGPTREACEKEAEYWQRYIELEMHAKLVEHHKPSCRLIAVRKGGGQKVQLRVAWEVEDG